MDKLCGSPFWDSNRTWYTDSPEFTKCFEETVLIWIPCALMWIFSIFEIYFLKTSLDENIAWNYLNVSKLVLNISLMALTLADLIMAIIRYNDNAIHPVDIFTPVIKLATFTLLLIFIPLNRKYGIQASCQFLFWFILVLFSIPRLLTELREADERNKLQHRNDWEEYKYDRFMLFLGLSIGMFLLNCFADATPRRGKYERTQNDCPELSASYFSRLTYSWFNALAWKGYRHPLEETDLWDLRPQDSCKEIIPLFQNHWNNMIKSKDRYGNSIELKKLETNMDKMHADFDSKTKNIGNASIVGPIIRSFGGTFLFGAMLKVFADLLTFAQPLILQLIIGFIEDYANTEKGPQPQWKGIFYAILLFTVSVTQTIFLAKYFNYTFLAGFRSRAALLNAVYRKSLIISNASRKESTVGEIVNLMAVDIQRVMDLTPYLNMIWSAPMQIILALYFLWRLMGPSVLVGVAIMIITIPLNGMLANRLKKLQIRQMKNKDERVKRMNEILNGIKVLKLYAWEPSFINQVLGIRSKEIATQKSTELLTAALTIVWLCAPFLVALVTFATYVLIDENNVLDAAKTFVSLSLFNILRFPLIMLPMVVTNFIQAQIATHRLNSFLNHDELDPNSVQHNEDDYPIAIVNGVFSWGNDEFMLRNINVQVKNGDLCAIVGTVGTGKSSLVQAFLGEMNKLAGRVNVYGTVAYVPQQAWIQNVSLRDNILFGKPYNRKRYNRIIDACALRADIEMLSAGDKTEIGEKGINLSGGQKQRVSLARAVYSDADLYFLDDPLSAVDSHVGKHIFEEVIGPMGLLAKKTRVLVTHGITFLPQTDNIYVMKDGEVSESGTYQELLHRKGAFSDFLIQHIQEGVEAVEELDEIGDQLSEHVELKKVVKRATLARMESLSDTTSFGDQSSLRHHRAERQDSTISEKSLTSQKLLIEEDGKLIDAEKSQTGRVSVTVYKYYIRSIGIFLAIGALIAIACFQTLQVLSNLWLTQWSHDSQVANNTSLRNMYLEVYGALGFGQIIAQFIFNATLAIGCLDSAKKLHESLLHNVLCWPMEMFDTTPLGRIVNRFSKDVDTVDCMLPANLRMLLTQTFAVIATIIVISLSTPLFLTIIIPLGILYYMLQNFYVATSRQLSRLESVSRSPIYSQFGETLSGLSTIRAFGAQELFIEESNWRVEKNQKCKYPVMITSRWLGVRLEMMGNFVILFAALFTVLGGQTNSALVGLAITYALQVTETFNWLVRMISDTESNIVAVERIREYGDMKKEAPWKKQDILVPDNWPTNGEVIFDKLKVRYRNGLDLVLKGISFKITGGEKVGIVGRTGAGKSSLTLALFRIIEAAHGRILIDNIDISTLGLHTLRSRLTIIPQDPVLFSGTLRINLDPFASKSDTEIWTALELSHLKAYVKSLAAGLNHEINEGGENLSVGQRQLVCLARALLRKTKVLVLDEATAAVDLETDDLIQKTIRSEFKDCTVLTIAHRLNTIMDSDRVIVLNNGQVAEFAPPNELLRNPKSLFYNMAKDSNLVQ